MVSNKFNIAYAGFWVLVLIGVLVWNGCKPKAIDEDSSYTKIATVTEDDEVIAVEANPYIDITTEYVAKDYNLKFYGKIYTFKKNGMEYLLVNDDGMELVNLTLDSLKVEKLKRNLQE